jgi:hypothetical protein
MRLVVIVSGRRCDRRLVGPEPERCAGEVRPVHHHGCRVVLVFVGSRPLVTEQLIEQRVPLRLCRDRVGYALARLSAHETRVVGAFRV